MELLPVPGVSCKERKIADKIIKILTHHGLPKKAVAFDNAHKKSAVGGEVGSGVQSGSAEPDGGGSGEEGGADQEADAQEEGGQQAAGSAQASGAEARDSEGLLLALRG